MTTDSQLPIVLVTGAMGQLGSELIKILSNGYQIVPVDQIDFDITNLKETMAFISDTRPNIVIHTAAFTDVDGCEREPNKAFNVNAVGTRNIVSALRKIDAKLFYISTDYVFDGAKEDSYLEADKPNPINIYGKSKLLGENSVKEELYKFFIIRTAWLYGLGGKNFVKTMLGLAREKEELQVVNDQRGAPTYAADLARQIKKLLPAELYGVYHSTSQGSCTWYEFALEIFKRAGYKAEAATGGSVRLTPDTQALKPIIIRPVASEKFPSLARRPKNSVLENHMLKLQGLDIMPPWQEALKEFMKRRGKQ